MSFVRNDVRNTPATRNVIESIIIGVVLTALSYLVGYEAGWQLTQGWQLYLEMFCVFTSYSCTYLCVRERRINYFIGFLSTAAYSWLFYEFGLNASAVLNAWLTIQLIIGFVWWKNDSNARPVTFMKPIQWLWLSLGTSVFFVIGYWLDTLAGGSFVWTDVLILVLTIAAQFMLDRKKFENWIVWFLVDVFATYEYFSQHLYLVGFQYVLFTLNCFYGLYVWWNSMRKLKDFTQP